MKQIERTELGIWLVIDDCTPVEVKPKRAKRAKRHTAVQFDLVKVIAGILQPKQLSYDI